MSGFKRECELVSKEKQFEYRSPSGEVIPFEKALHFTTMELPLDKLAPYAIAYGFRDA